MKKILLPLAFLLLTFVSTTFAQGNLSVAYVNPSQLFAAHPAGQEAAALMEERDTELAPLIEELQGVQQKAETAEGLTNEERSRASLLVRSIQASQSSWTEQIRQAALPAEAAINEAIETVAKAGGYTLVLAAELAGAGGSSLIVYADRDAVPDITADVVALLSGE